MVINPIDNGILNRVCRDNRRSGSTVIILCSRDCAENVHGDLDSIMKVNKMVSTLRRMCLCGKVLFYEGLTEKRGNGCLEDAIKNLSKVDEIRNLLTTQDVSIIAWRGMEGKQHLFKMTLLSNPRLGCDGVGIALYKDNAWDMVG